MRPLLLQYASRPRSHPRPLIRVPSNLATELAQNGLGVVEETLVDGNCGLHAFGIGVLQAGKKYCALARTSVYKKLSATREPLGMVKLLRGLAIEWMRAHGDVAVWDGMSVKFLAMAMSSFPGTYPDYLERMSQSGQWIDACVLHCLGCHLRVDVVVWQPGLEPTLVGVSLWEGAPAHDEPPLVHVAMVNDLHFWGVERIESVVVPIDRGEWLPIVPHVARESKQGKRAQPSDDVASAEFGGDGVDSDDEHCWSLPGTVFLGQGREQLNHEAVEAELALCKCLRDWCPWGAPSPELLQAVQALAAVSNPTPVSQRCVVRSQALEDLLYEQASWEKLPEKMKYHSAARYRISSQRVTVRNSKARTQTALEHVQAHLMLDIDNIKKRLAADCSRHGKKHHCLDNFRACPSIVRNWQVLWRSLTPALRRESLVRMFAASFAAHRASGALGECTTQHQVLGVNVCAAALQVITGISGYSLTKARAGAAAMQQSSLSLSELPRRFLITNTNKEKLYLDARLWLEYYAETHGDFSPISGDCYLPAGRKICYWHVYAQQRKEASMPFASVGVFRESWRCECPWLIVERGTSTFTACGICTYLRQQIDLVPRGQPDILDALKERLARHYEFQSAQRLAQARVEEICHQSQGTKWSMVIDKMDQQRTILPAVWAQRRAPIMKLGERLVTGVIGSWWDGVQHTQMLLRTVFEDCEHGSETQCSTVLMNLHRVATRERHLPEEFTVHADNTAKETKNEITIWFMTWLLCVLQPTALSSVLLLFLLVGHTHNKLDRFFSRLGVSLQGHDYMTWDQMFQTIKDALTSFEIDTSHVTHVWNWKMLKNEMPSFSRLRSVHAINIFRQGGVWIKWKQYMTDEAWSRPICLVPAHMIPHIAAIRPERIPQTFGAKRGKMLAWANKFEAFLADAHSSNDRRSNDVNWFRAVVNGEIPTFTAGPSLDDIVQDLLVLGGVPGARAAGRDAPKLPEDQLVQLFPGADHGSMPVDMLVQVTGRHAPRQEAPPNVVCPGSLLICRAPEGTTCYGDRLMFLVGSALPDTEKPDGRVLVAWWVPPLAPAVTFKPGKKKRVLDHFGSWKPLEALSISDAKDINLPPVLVNHADVMLANVELDDGKVPFSALDILRSDFFIDMTALSVSRTQDGNNYRQWALMH